ncbi:hypothetical protein MRB53_006922 [Persea americana]|uniref:Uncharacterized protein n=1 Tax=Persea americana TaxID=3435 RepID=A0ACC2MHI7_PERAE|nr:hypothetical protein MRB53_006922 [Persea americana]
MSKAVSHPLHISRSMGKVTRTVSSLVGKDSIGEFLRNPGPSLTLFGAHALPDASQVATAVSLHRSKSVRSLLGSLSLSIHLFSSVMCYSWKSVGFQGDKACF